MRRASERQEEHIGGDNGDNIHVVILELKYKFFRYLDSQRMIAVRLYRLGYTTMCKAEKTWGGMCFPSCWWQESR